MSDSLQPHGLYVAYQAPQEYWSGLPFPSPEDLPNPGIEPGSPTLRVGTLPSEPPGKLQKKRDAVAAWAGKLTRASCVAGENSTTEPPMTSLVAQMVKRLPTVQ